MILANVNWLGVLSSALSLASAVQLLITGMLSFGFAEFLTFTGCVYATGAGLVAGFVVLPNTIRIRSSQSLPEMDKTYGYTVCYQKLAMSISLALHIAAAILTIIALTCSGGMDEKFYELMKAYGSRQVSKSMVDNIQWALQCCGAQGYIDWFKVDWTGCSTANDKMKSNRKKKSYASNDYDNDIVEFRQDEVPFSCCTRKILVPCVHQDLNQFGTFSINSNGCGLKLRHTVYFILIFEFFLYMLCVCLEVAVIVLLHKSPDHSKAVCITSSARKYSKKSSTPRSSKSSRRWDKFSNESKSTTAEISPSSQAQVVILSSTIEDTSSHRSVSQSSLTT